MQLPGIEPGSSWLSNICDFVFHNHYAHYQDHEWLASTAIITATNDATKMMNSYMMQKFPDDELLYQRSDSVDQEHIYPLEFINYLNLSGFLSHLLRLKVGTCTMLLGNLDPGNGHCNRTWNIITHLDNHINKGKVATECHKASDCLSPAFHWCCETASFLSR